MKLIFGLELCCRSVRCSLLFPVLIFMLFGCSNRLRYHCAAFLGHCSGRLQAHPVLDVDATQHLLGLGENIDVCAYARGKSWNETNVDEQKCRTRAETKKIEIK